MARLLTELVTEPSYWSNSFSTSACTPFDETTHWANIFGSILNWPKYIWYLKINVFWPTVSQHTVQWNSDPTNKIECFNSILLKICIWICICICNCICICICICLCICICICICICLCISICIKSVVFYTKNNLTSFTSKYFYERKVFAIFLTNRNGRFNGARYGRYGHRRLWQN